MTLPAWSDDRVEQLKRLWESGLSCSQIAAELGGVTRNAVIGKIHRLGLAPRAKAPTTAAPRPRKRAAAPNVMAPTRQRRTLIRQVFAEPAEPQQAEETETAVGGEFVSATAFDDSVPADQRKSLIELEHGDCRWPIGDPATENFFFCGAAAVDGLPYCGRHCRIAYEKPGARAVRISEEERARRAAVGRKMSARNRDRRAAAS